MGYKAPWNKEDRAAGDFYSTDPRALQLFLRHYEQNLRGLMIWEPACGSGNLSKVLLQIPFCDVISTDLHDRGFGIAGVDFLQSDRLERVSCILTNPPYSLATEFIEHSLDVLPDNGLAIFLLNLNYITGKDRYKRVYSKGCLESLWVFPTRINCYKNDVRTKDAGSVNYAWFVFRKTDKPITPTIHFINM